MALVRHQWIRDIKPENILVGLHGEAKLADLGWLARTPSKRREVSLVLLLRLISLLQKKYGTLDYFPPEMVEQRQYTYKSTTGVLCYELLAGTPPFETQTINDTQRRIVNTQYTFPSLVKEDARDLIKYVLQDDFDKRLELE